MLISFTLTHFYAELVGAWSTCLSINVLKLHTISLSRHKSSPSYLSIMPYSSVLNDPSRFSHLCLRRTRVLTNFRAYTDADCALEDLCQPPQRQHQCALSGWKLGLPRTFKAHVDVKFTWLRMKAPDCDTPQSSLPGLQPHVSPLGKTILVFLVPGLNQVLVRLLEAPSRVRDALAPLGKL